MKDAKSTESEQKEREELIRKKRSGRWGRGYARRPRDANQDKNVMEEGG